MHRQLARANALALTDVTQQLAGQLGALAVKHLPAHDLAAEQILEQVQVKVLAAHLSGQIRDIPAEHLIGSGGGKGARPASLLRCALRASMAQLALLSKYSVHRGLRGHIDAAVGQARHDLARRQVLERFAVERGHHRLALVLAQLVGRAHIAPLARRTLVALGRLRALPALHATAGQPDLMASRLQARPVGAGLADQAEQLLALLDGRHLSAPSSSAWKFFCNTSKAATSASAFSLRRNSRWSCSC
ncbi:hypothetical protein POHY109586_06025 [Polaromonas hydrogenivorans]